MATQNLRVNATARRRKRNTRGSGQVTSSEHAEKLGTINPWVDTQQIKMSEASHESDVSIGKRSRASDSPPDLILEQVTHPVNPSSSVIQPSHSGNPSDEILQCPNVSQSSDSTVEDDHEQIGEAEQTVKRAQSPETEMGAHIITALAAANAKKVKILEIRTKKAEIDAKIATLEAEKATLEAEKATLEAEKAKLNEREGMLAMEIEETYAIRDSKVNALEKKIAKIQKNK